MLKHLFSGLKRAKPAAASTGGRTLYAIGDIHGRLDLFQRLVAQIAADVDETAGERPLLVLLGDYVDRGPQSREVLDAVIALKASPAFEVVALIGNHEETFLAFLEDAAVGPTWADFGGAQTLASYGVSPPQLRADAPAWEEARTAFAAIVPESHVALLKSLALFTAHGDYVFVHAGVRPGVPLDRQDSRDLLWIRDEFLNVDHGLGMVVVHGHTPEVEPHLGSYRIGIDTGAYATGVLTAVKLQGEAVSVLRAQTGRP